MTVTTNRILLLCLSIIIVLCTTPGVQGRCAGRQFECANKDKCIPLSWKCDGEHDCDDQSDEKECAPKTCSATEFQCRSGDHCVLERWRCDGDDDCPDGSDEDHEMCEKKTCPTDQFACGQAGMCIPLSWRCDEQPDCPDEADEHNCTSSTCSPDEFRCNNTKCVTMKWKCDQDNDCGDNSDEDACPKKTCSPTEFQCANGKCIPQRWSCDGDVDCTDHSDEKNCNGTSEASRCSANEFTCKSGHCIHKSWQCDSDPDCQDGSDEENCGEQTCGGDRFKCKTSSRPGLACILSVQQCDGQPQCEDGSDEEGCEAPPAVCDPATQFDCTGNGRNCIDVAKVCNRHNDCGSGEDERPDLCEKTKANPCEVENGGCTHICKSNVNGVFCLCKPGFQLQADNKTCEDIDECKIQGKCSHICNNTKGGYKCSCHPGYFVDPNQHHFCKATGAEPSLIFANRHDIREYKVHSLDFFNLVDQQRSAVAVDFDYKKNRLYWSDVAHEQILGVNMTTSHHEISEDSVVIVGENISTPDGIALDWIHGNLYWTDTGINVIEVINLKSRMRTVLINSSLEEPRALVLDPRENQGYMYWTDWGEQARIEKAGMDGTHRKAIIDVNIKWPNGLAIDYVDNRLYWVDAKLHLIASSDLEGLHRIIHLTNDRFLHHPFAVAVFEDTIYWTDWDTEAVHKINKFNDTRVENMISGLITPMDIHVFHDLKQPEAPNRCGDNNGHCSHLCLPAPHITSGSAKYSCHCEKHIRLSGDGRTCLVPDGNGALPTTTKPGPETAYVDVNKPKTRDAEEQDVGRVAAIVIGVVVLIALIAAVIGFFVYRSYMRRNIRSMNFDNPVYRKTTEDQFSLEKNQYQPSQTLPSTLEPLTSSREHDVH